MDDMGDFDVDEIGIELFGRRISPIKEELHVDQLSEPVEVLFDSPDGVLTAQMSGIKVGLNPFYGFPVDQSALQRRLEALRNRFFTQEGMEVADFEHELDDLLALAREHNVDWMPDAA